MANARMRTAAIMMLTTVATILEPKNPPEKLNEIGSKTAKSKLTTPFKRVYRDLRVSG